MGLDASRLPGRMAQKLKVRASAWPTLLVHVSV